VKDRASRTAHPGPSRDHRVVPLVVGTSYAEWRVTEPDTADAADPLASAPPRRGLRRTAYRGMLI
jgi:hypothetical protein